MTKKSGSKSSKPKGMTAEDHRKMSQTHYAKGRLHSAKAELMEAQNPPKKGAVRDRPY